MDKNEINLILQLIKECNYYSEHSIKFFDFSNASAIQFINQAFLCNKKIQTFYFQVLKEKNPDLKLYNDAFFALNNNILSGDRDKAIKKLEILKTLQTKLNTNTLSQKTGIDIDRFLKNTE